MKPLNNDCAEKDWRTLLKRNLQDGIEVTLDNFDYSIDGQFCEILAISHALTFRLDIRNKGGKVQKTCGGRMIGGNRSRLDKFGAILLN
jgi:hypothetical protein